MLTLSRLLVTTVSGPVGDGGGPEFPNASWLKLLEEGRRCREPCILRSLIPIWKAMTMPREGGIDTGAVRRIRSCLEKRVGEEYDLLFVCCFSKIVVDGKYEGER